MKNIFSKLENAKPFLKMCLNGFAGSGKSFTATQIAIGLHKLIQSKKPIAIFDTERAFKALLPQFQENEIEAIHSEARNLATLKEAIKYCEKGGADILIIDSITHVYEQFIQDYLKGKQGDKQEITIRDWGIIKPKWKRDFSDYFVRSNLHIIFTGRAGYEYETERNERGKLDFFKSNIKMKADNETEFEPDIAILMSQVSKVLEDKKIVSRSGFVKKDRTGKIDGKEFKNPTFEDLLPAINQLLDGVVKDKPVVELQQEFEKDMSYMYSVQKDKREALMSEITGHFDYMALGTSKEEKAVKAKIIKDVFGCTSKKGIDTMAIEQIEKGLNIIKEFSSWFVDYKLSCEQEGVNPEKEIIFEELGQCVDDWGLEVELSI